MKEWYRYINVLACAVISSNSISPFLTLATISVKKSCRDDSLSIRLYFGQSFRCGSREK